MDTPPEQAYSDGNIIRTIDVVFQEGNCDYGSEHGGNKRPPASNAKKDAGYHAPDSGFNHENTLVEHERGRHCTNHPSHSSRTQTSRPPRTPPVNANTRSHCTGTSQPPPHPPWILTAGSISDATRLAPQQLSILKHAISRFKVRYGNYSTPKMILAGPGASLDWLSFTILFPECAFKLQDIVEALKDWEDIFLLEDEKSRVDLLPVVEYLSPLTSGIHNVVETRLDAFLLSGPTARLWRSIRETFTSLGNTVLSHLPSLSYLQEYPFGKTGVFGKSSFETLCRAINTAEARVSRVRAALEMFVALDGPRQMVRCPGPPNEAAEKHMPAPADVEGFRRIKDRARIRGVELQICETGERNFGEIYLRAGARNVTGLRAPRQIARCETMEDELGSGNCEDKNLKTEAGQHIKRQLGDPEKSNSEGESEASQYVISRNIGKCARVNTFESSVGEVEPQCKEGLAKASAIGITTLAAHEVKDEGA